MTIQYRYEDVLKAAEKVNWTISDLIGNGQKMDFTKPFLPESLARTEGLTFMDNREKIIFNQIRGHSYLYIFSLVEEFILPFVEQHAKREGIIDALEAEAFTNFASEEEKHIELFKKFRAEFQQDFGVEIDVIGPADAIADAILAHHPLAVAIATLHIEWMTQRHYLEGVKDNKIICPQFESLLRHHWMEEAQHAKLDTNMVLSIAEGLSQAELEEALGDYVKIGGILDGGLKAQAEFDLDAFERATGRVLNEQEREQFFEVQNQAFRWSYLGSGMTHPKFLETLGKIAPFMREAVESVSPDFC